MVAGRHRCKLGANSWRHAGSDLTGRTNTLPRPGFGRLFATNTFLPRDSGEGGPPCAAGWWKGRGRRRHFDDAGCTLTTRSIESFHSENYSSLLGGTVLQRQRSSASSAPSTTVRSLRELQWSPFPRFAGAEVRALAFSQRGPRRSFIQGEEQIGKVRFANRYSPLAFPFLRKRRKEAERRQTQVTNRRILRRGARSTERARLPAFHRGSHLRELFHPKGSASGQASWDAV